MATAAPTAPVNEAVLATPAGRLAFAADGSAHLVLRAGARNRDAVTAAVEAATRLGGHRFWLHDEVSHEADGIHLRWRAPGDDRVALGELVVGWRKEPALFLPAALGLARHLLHASSELEGLRPHRYLLSPAQLFRLRDDSPCERWVVLPLPVEGAVFADFAHADEALVDWLSGDELTGTAPADRGYLVGAAIYHSLVGGLLPSGLSRGERVRRVLTYRCGNAGLARTALTGALPQPLANHGRRLVDFLMELLSPGLGRAMTAAQAARELDGFYATLSACNLASHWESGGDRARALKLLDALALSAPAGEVPWEAVERLRAWAGDLRGAAQAAARRTRPPEEHSAGLIASIRQLAGRGEAGKRELGEVIQELRALVFPDDVRAEEQSGGVQRADGGAPHRHHTGIPDEAYLYMAYANGRWLARPDESLRWLEREFPVSWHQVVRTAVAARLHAEQGSWVEVVRQCRAGRARVAKMPDAGGQAGRYAEAYLDLLDGIAHLSAVSQDSHPPVYLHDGFVRLRNAWLQLGESGSEDLESAIVGWLQRLAEVSGRHSDTALLALGVDAFARLHAGAAPRNVGGGAPAIPWFDEDRLFPA